MILEIRKSNLRGESENDLKALLENTLLRIDSSSMKVKEIKAWLEK